MLYCPCTLPTLQGYSQEIFISMNVEDYAIAAQGILQNWELMPSCIGCYWIKNTCITESGSTVQYYDLIGIYCKSVYTLWTRTITT